MRSFSEICAELPDSNNSNGTGVSSVPPLMPERLNLYYHDGKTYKLWNRIFNHEYFIFVYMISGTCAGLAGIVMTGRLNAAAPTAGIGYETFAIAATIIGGTSFFGGVGKIPGVVAGGLIIGIINYGMTVLMIDASMQKVVMGALIIVAVTLDHLVSKSAKR